VILDLFDHVGLLPWKIITTEMAVSSGLFVDRSEKIEVLD
jgi:hypothetical protein